MPQQSNPYEKQNKFNLSNEGKDSKKVDAWMMTEAAKRLNDIQSNPKDKEAFRTALRINWRMWTIIQAELTEENCPLPHEIRQNLLTLSNFVDKQTLLALGSLKAKDLEILISINKEIAAGLMNNGGDVANDAESSEKKEISNISGNAKNS